MTLALALVASGCGGGAATDAPAPAAAPAPGAAAPATGAAGGTTVAGATAAPTAAGDAAAGAAQPLGATPQVGSGGEGVGPFAGKMANSKAAPNQLVKVTAITPSEFAKAHCSKPIIVVVTQPKDLLGDALVAEARAAASAVDDTVMLSYDAGEYRTYGDLVTMLGLFKTPAVGIVARDGRIENFWTTFVDRGLLTKSLNSAAAAKPCRPEEAVEEDPNSALDTAAALAATGSSAAAPSGVATSSAPVAGAASL